VKPDDFVPTRRLHLVPIEHGQWAYVPPSLPTEIDLSREAIMAMSAADRAIGALDGIGGWMPNPYLLVQPFLHREAVLSSRIEGTQASLSDLAVFEAAVPAPGLPPDVREVANYVKALEFALAPERDLPISMRLFQRLHEVLMEGVRGQDQRPGEFRTIQNYIGRPGSRIEDASYVPPPPQQMMESLYDFERFLHSPTTLPPLVRLAMTHYQFEAIHPFRDGNGRVGRLLVALLLVEERLISQPLLYLSAFFEAHRGAYYERLSAVSQNGDWDAWIRFFLQAVAEQATDAVERARRLLALRDTYHGRLQAARASALPMKLVDGLFMSPVVTVVGAMHELDVTHRAASLIVDKLVNAEILTPMTPGLARNRLYFAMEILDLLQRELPTTDRGAAPLQQTLELG
jgi:Fic family protein